MKTKTIEQIREMGHTDALVQCWDSGDSGTPDGGWDSWLINGVGILGVCRLFGESPAANQDGWCDSMKAKLEAYHEGALQGAAEYAQSVADADASNGEDWADADFKDPYDSP